MGNLRSVASIVNEIVSKIAKNMAEKDEPSLAQKSEILKKIKTSKLEDPI